MVGPLSLIFGQDPRPVALARLYYDRTRSGSTEHKCPNALGTCIFLSQRSLSWKRIWRVHDGMLLSISTMLFLPSMIDIGKKGLVGLYGRRAEVQCRHRFGPTDFGCRTQFLLEMKLQALKENLLNHFLSLRSLIQPDWSVRWGPLNQHKCVPDKSRKVSNTRLGSKHKPYASMPSMPTPRWVSFLVT